MNFSKYPLLKVLFPYVLGVIIAYICDFPPKYCFFFLCSTGVLWLISVVLLQVKDYRWRWMKFFVMFVAFVFAGMFTTIFRLSPKLSAEQQEQLASGRNFVVRVVDFPVPRAKSVKLQAELLQTTTDQPLRERVLLYLQKSPAAETVHYGDVLLVSTQLSEFAPPANPDAFDNRQYMRRKGIFYSGYVPASGWQLLDHKVPNPLKELSRRLQQRLSGTFAAAGMSGQEYDIVRAILLGDDDTMEPELRAAYASAGVSHILCVSGMHVGIIFMILNFLFKPLDLFQSTRVLKSIMLLLTIWLYANITGLSPSVTRSATMFSFVIVGSLIQRNTNVFHSLLASLFVLLVINPMLLFEVGFQLSYLAVFGIVLLQPLIAGIYQCKTKVGNYFWELMSVSAAAQISTFPISIYYFGQFPNYFLLSNLSVIALSFVVMISGVVLLAVAFIPFLACAVSFLLTWEIRIMNWIVTFVESLPGAVTQNIDYSVFQVLLLYAFIIVLYCAFCFKRRSLGWLACSIFALFSGTFLLRKVSFIYQDEMVVYNIRKASAISFCSQQRCILFSDSITSDTCQSFQYSMKNHARKLHAQWEFVPIDTVAFESPHLCKRGNFIQYYNICYYLLKRKDRLYPTASRPVVDKLLLQYNPTMLPEKVREALDFKAVVADGTCTEFYKKRWREYCEKEGVPFEE